ncbi:MAG: O-antigen ligase family protein [Cyclobacteriaceae bacterium]|nr:O-antigen ligase family protein [Cyclobacteriaceae bacterium]
MITVIYIVSFVFVILILRKPYIGIATILGLISFQGLIGDWLEDSELFFQVFGAATIFGYFLNYVHRANRSLFRVSPTALLILFFAIFLLISNYGVALNSTERNWFSTYLQLFALVVLIENVITSRNDIENLMLWFSIGSVLYFANIIFILSESGQEGLIEGANLYTRAFIIAALFTYYHLKKASKNKYLLIILLLIQCAGIVLSQSRTGIILLFIALIYILYKDYNLSLRSVIVILLGGLLIYYLVPEDVINSIQTDFSDKPNLRNPGKVDYSSIDTNIRFYLWGIGYDLWVNSNIFLGIGIGQFKAVVVSYLPGLETGIGLHNTYLSILFETGIFGFLIFMGFIVRALRIYFISGVSEKRVGISTVWLMCFIVILIGGMTKHEHYDKILFSVIGMSYFFSRRSEVKHAEN